MYERILLATDGSDPSKVAAERAIELASGFSCDLIAIYVINEFLLHVMSHRFKIDKEKVQEDYENTAHAVLADVRKQGKANNVVIETIITQGQPSASIVATAEDKKVDLIVMGTRGESSHKGVTVGSVAGRVLRDAPCSVLVSR